MNNEVKVIEYGLGDNDEYGVYAISLVDEPAIEVDFVALNKDRILLARVQDGEKRMLYGPALIPNQAIVRYDKNGAKYFIKYSPETIEKTAQEFLKRNLHHNHTVQHELPVAGLTVVESWIKQGADKGQEFGFDLPDGTWMIGVKVEDENTWEAVKQGVLKGFSIEGFFVPEKEEVYNESELEAILTSLVNEIGEIK
jgi:Putative phage serine protease XkdF